jgi:hypothetical protein
MGRATERPVNNDLRDDIHYSVQDSVVGGVLAAASETLLSPHALALPDSSGAARRRASRSGGGVVGAVKVFASAPGERSRCPDIPIAAK